MATVMPLSKTLAAPTRETVMTSMEVGEAITDIKEEEGDQEVRHSTRNIRSF